MYKLIAVDDEKDIQETLSSFPWGDLGIELVAICENGLTAYKTLLETDADIVLTDIRMPILDGLKLVNNIRAERSYVKTVILSAYSDYEYMRQSLTAGVCDYVLKPVDPNDLGRVFSKLVDELDRERQQKKKAEFLKSKLRFATRALRREFLSRLFSTPMSGEEIQENSVYGEMQMDSREFLLLVLQFDELSRVRNSKSYENWNLLIFGLEKLLNDFLAENERGYGWIDPVNGGCHILWFENLPKEQLVSLVDRLKDTFYTMGGLFRSTMSCAACYPLTAYTAIYENAQRAKQYLEKNENADSLILVPAVDSAQVYETTAPTEEDLSQSKTSQRYLVHQALQYIHENYMRTITLNDVAEAVYLSPIYLSSIFKKITHTNFIEYLTGYRIEQSKKLLKSSQCKISEIGERVGYENPRYFTQVFKKIVGCTPNEYRSAMIQKRDELE